MPESSPPTRHDFVELVAPYRDTRAQDLCWSLTLPVQPALAVRTVRLGGFVLELRLLGASHQVLVWAEAGTELLCVETVACLPGMAGPLPDQELLRSCPTGGLREWNMRGRCSLSLGGPEFDRAVQRVRRAVEANPHSLAASYPGAPGALTAVLPEQVPTGVRWTTWHSYPQDGKLVRTRSGFRRTLSPRQRGPAANHDPGEGVDGVRSYGAGSPPVAVVSRHRP